jgi:XTP/dITP diphosphohydrolase
MTATRRLGPGKLVIATHNAGKLREIRALLAPYGLDCVSAGELGLPEPAETGTTFVENALIKAHAAAQGANLPALADDSGLSVAALGGAPGVYTADWAETTPLEGGPGRDWYMAMGKVEGKLAGLGPDAARDAWFSCVLAHLAAARHAGIWL